MISGICPKPVSSWDILEPTALKHQRRLNKNSTFLNATSYLVMIYEVSIAGGVILHGDIWHCHNSRRPSAKPRHKTLSFITESMYYACVDITAWHSMCSICLI